MRRNLLILSLVFILSAVSFGQNENESFYNNFFKGLEYFEKEDFNNAKTYYLKAWDEAKLFKDDDELKANSAAVCASTLYVLEEYESAAQFYEEACRLMRLQGKDKEDVYDDLHFNATKTFFILENYEKAVEYVLESLQLLERKYGKENLSYAYRLSDAGDAYSSLNRTLEAANYYQAATDLFKRIDQYDDVVSRNVRRELAVALINTERVKEGRDLLRELYDYTNANGLQNQGDYYKIAMNLMNSEKALGNFQSGYDLLTELKDVSLEYGEGNELTPMLLGHRGSFSRFLANYDEAINDLTYAITELDKLGVNDTYIVASFYGELGLAQFRKGDYESAEKNYLKCLDLLDALEKTTDVQYVGTLGNMAYLYQLKGLFQDAKTYYDKAFEIHEQVNSQEDRQFSIILMNYGVLFKEMTNYEEAEKKLLRAKDLIMKFNGTEHINYATVSLNLGELYYWKQDFKTSIDYNKIASEIYEEKTTKQDPMYSYALSNLSLNYLELGDYEKSLDFSLQAKEHLKNTVGTKHIEYGKVCQNLAKTYTILGNYEEAIAHYNETLENYKVTIGGGHYMYANMAANMARVLIDLELYDLAQELTDIAISIFEKTHGKDSFYYATGLTTKVDLLMARNQYSEAIEVCKEIIRIFSLSHGEDNNLLLNNYFKLGKIYQQTGNHDMSLTYYSRYNSEILRMMENVFTYRSESDKRKFASQIRFWLSRYHSLYAEPGYDQDRLVTENLNLNLIFNGLLLSSSKDILTKLQSLNDSEINKKLSDFRSGKTTLTNQYSLPIEERKVDVETLKNDINDMETELVELYNSKFDDNFTFDKNWINIKENLGTDELAIEFVETNPLRNDTILLYESNYSAYLINKKWDVPKRVDLFTGEEIKPLLSSKTPNQIYASRGSKGQSVTNTKGVYELIWKPLESYLTGIKTIYYSPSGVLNQIPFAALGEDGGLLLSSQFNLVQLSSTYNIINSRTNPKADQTLFIGGIDYESKLNSDVSSADIDYLNLGGKENGNGTRSRGDSWNYLKGTLEEINTIQDLYTSANRTYYSWTGEEGTEANFKALSGQSPKILHIATHGFFYENKRESDGEVSLSETENQYQYAEDPLLRSALIFAGANDAWINGSKDPETDGILTAMEISNLDLSNTDMVVLSACETGLGDIDGSEGVYGLQRAFKMAGVDIIVMSLWQVPDKETAEFMTLFYTNWLKGTDVRDAFNSTQKTMQERYKDEPLKWAAFVLFE